MALMRRHINMLYLPRKCSLGMTTMLSSDALPLITFQFAFPKILSFLLIWGARLVKLLNTENCLLIDNTLPKSILC